MNYEEMLDKRDGVSTHQEKMPLGTFYKKLIDHKYRNVVELRPELSDSMFFCDGLKSDAEFTGGFRSNSQMHFTINADSNGIYELELENGNYATFYQLLTNNPALVAQSGFVDQVLKQMASFLGQLHEKNVFACCLAPQNVFVRKSGNTPRVLTHGSFYKDKKALYEGFEDYVAPEVLEGGDPDMRSDVYAMGKFMQWLMADGGLSFEYKKAVAKAIDPAPANRYATPEEMMQAITRKRGFGRTLFALIAAIVIALLCVGIYFEAVPQPVDVEFVEPAEQYDDNPFDDEGLTDAELAGGSNDTTSMSEDEREELAAMQTKSEAIFKKQFTREAERVLSKIYSKEHMNSSQQAFIATSNTLMDELIRRRDELAAQSGLPVDKTNHLASEIISSIREQKKKQLKVYGGQAPSE